MNMSILSLGVLAVAGTLFGLTTLTDENAKAVERAVLDYVEAVEQGKPELIERSVHPELAKFGFSRERGDAEWRRHPMTFAQLVELAGEMKAKGYVPADPRHEVELLDVMDKTASVKLTAFWGIDYMHLVNYQGKWKIVHVLWQTEPMPRNVTEDGGSHEHDGEHGHEHGK